MLTPPLLLLPLLFWGALLAGSKLAMPVEIVQFCHKYTLARLQVRRGRLWGKSACSDGRSCPLERGSGEVPRQRRRATC